MEYFENDKRTTIKRRYLEYFIIANNFAFRLSFRKIFVSIFHDIVVNTWINKKEVCRLTIKTKLGHVLLSKVSKGFRLSIIFTKNFQLGKRTGD